MTLGLRISVGRWGILATILTAILAFAPPATGTSEFEPPPLPTTGKGLYMQACAACHGPDGKGQPAQRLGFQPLPPDFTDCSFASREGNSDWSSVAHKGGPARGFSTIMPAFDQMFSEAQVIKILDYIRTFCTNKCWPRGELNLPKALFTTKAFPEDEVVVQSVYDTTDPQSVTNKLYYEQRIGPRGQIEVIVPWNWEQSDNGQGGTEWNNGLGDVGMAYKHVVYASLDTGAIVSLGGELFFPTGDDDKGLGKGTSVFEPYVAYGQLLPADLFMQFQGGGAIPMDGSKSNEELFGRLVLGRSFTAGQWDRRWSPMVELLATQEMVSGADLELDLAPQFQVTLSARQQVRLGLGARIPLTQTDTRDVQYGLYLLWDWFDGGLFEGW
ncbi:MAG: c-type cytochrome [Deltaproteobacteria bacterium]|nr:c-type cytochrome [Deltaproteobacteria bacterium]